ncbi:MAG: DUF5591 domain-containing protein [Nanoarchaeota archaeon]|nr:DUF5591 domain-containing protein [Nanoarchaeota archaeon]
MKSKNTSEKTLILSSGKCSWGKCVFCGWGRLESKVDIHGVKNALDKALNTPCKHVKIFASGSVLDEKQFSDKILKYLVKLVKEKGVKKITVESRPEFITKEKLDLFKGLKLTVATGLETSDDALRKRLAKGFTNKDFLRAARVLRKWGAGVKVYILVNPPFAKNVEKSLKKSVEFADKHADEIVLINTFPHANAPINELWLKGEWKPLNKREFEELVKPFTKNKKIQTDFSNFDFKPRFPEPAKQKIVGATKKQLLHPHFKVWQDYLVRLYEPPKTYALFVPCAYKKPYTHSRTWRAIKRVTRKYRDLHLIAISNPGVVPEEFADHYPFNSYDWPEKEETPAVKKSYIKVIKQRVKNYLSAHKYEKVFGYFKPKSESWQALKKACEELGIPLTQCLKHDLNVKGEEALQELDQTLKKFF